MVSAHRLGAEILHANNPYDDEIEDEDLDFVVFGEEKSSSELEKRETPDEEKYVPIKSDDLDLGNDSGAGNILLVALVAMGIAVVIGGVVYVSKSAYPKVKKWAQSKVIPAIKGKWATLTKNEKKRLLAENCEGLLQENAPVFEKESAHNLINEKSPYDILSENVIIFDEMARTYDRIKRGHGISGDAERYDLYLKASHFTEFETEAALARRSEELQREAFDDSDM